RGTVLRHAVLADAERGGGLADLSAHARPARSGSGWPCTVHAVLPARAARGPRRRPCGPAPRPDRRVYGRGDLRCDAALVHLLGREPSLAGVPRDDSPGLRARVLDADRSGDHTEPG